MTRQTVTLDPAVAAILGDGDRRERERRLGRAERRKRARDRARSKATYDLPDRIIDEIKRVAERESCSASSLVGFLLAYGLNALEQGTLSLEGHFKPSRSPRFDWILEIPDALLDR